MNIKTEIKHVTDRRIHITMTVKIDGTEKSHCRHGISGYNHTTGRKIFKDKKILPRTKNYQDVNKNEVKFAGKIMVEAENKELERNYHCLLPNEKT